MRLMRTPHVRLLCPSGVDVAVGPGGIIGRLDTAACRIQDPRVSEAHALVSLRGEAFYALSLRGRLKVDGESVDESMLLTGQHIELADGVVLRVTDVVIPDTLLAMQVNARPPTILSATVYSLRTAPVVELVSEYIEDAPLRLWSTAQGWTLAVEGGAPQPVRAGRSWQVAGAALRAVDLDLADASAPATVGHVAADALTLVLRYTAVHIHRARRDPVVFDGLRARLITELGLMRQTAPWEVLARELWPGDEDMALVRPRWDRLLARVRQTLRDASIREDLVRPDGCGNVELYLQPGDRVVDEA